MEDKEEYLVRMDIKIQDTQNIIPKFKDKANIAPK